jgi:TM2 domain-containing membrane protein YozV
MFCQNCGKEISDQAPSCPGCGHPVRAAGAANMGPGNASGKRVSPSSRLAALLLCIFLGVIGVHRFYVGKIGTGIAMIFTLGGFGIWVVIDFIMIVVGGFTDADGRYVLDWQT